MTKTFYINSSFVFSSCTIAQVYWKTLHKSSGSRFPPLLLKLTQSKFQPLTFHHLNMDVSQRFEEQPCLQSSPGNIRSVMSDTVSQGKCWMCCVKGNKFVKEGNIKRFNFNISCFRVIQCNIQNYHVSVHFFI